ncbi:MAG: ABC transporter ATP-binding protein [Gammaproteobacteria bacterium]|nr:ABC transporter ATP-binding protein [Gammaproteobacteria bacterium]
MNDVPEQVLPMEAVPLSIAGLGAGYGPDSPDVLRDFSIELQPGTITGLLGRNGSGKTTVMEVVLGLTFAGREGSVTMFGEGSQPPYWRREVSNRVGYVPQRFSGFGWLKVDACLALVSAHYDHWDYDLADRLRREWRLQNRRIGELPPGDRQKVAVLLAIGHRPDLLMLDEPVSSLDPSARRDFLAALVELNADQGQTVLLASHVTSDIERLATHIAILHRGRIACHAALDEIRDRLGVATLDTPPPLPPEKTFASHGNRYWIWDPHDGCLPANVRIEGTLLEDLFLAVTSK